MTARTLQSSLQNAGRPIVASVAMLRETSHSQSRLLSSHSAVIVDLRPVLLMLINARLQSSFHRIEVVQRADR